MINGDGTIYLSDDVPALTAAVRVAISFRLRLVFQPIATRHPRTENLSIDWLRFKRDAAEIFAGGLMMIVRRPTLAVRGPQPSLCLSRANLGRNAPFIYGPDCALGRVFSRHMNSVVLKKYSMELCTTVAKLQAATANSPKLSFKRNRYIKMV
jgi:hypothetical protein